MREFKSAVISRFVNFSAAMLIQSAAAEAISSKSEQALDAIHMAAEEGGEAWT